MEIPHWYWEPPPASVVDRCEVGGCVPPSPMLPPRENTPAPGLIGGEFARARNLG